LDFINYYFNEKEQDIPYIEIKRAREKK